MFDWLDEDSPLSPRVWSPVKLRPVASLDTSHCPRRAARLVGSALLVAVVLTASSGEWAPTALAAPALVGVCVGLIVMTWSTGWPVLPVVTLSVLLVGTIASALFYDDQAGVPPDLRVSGMDEIGRDPASVVFVLPFAWVLIVVVLVCRAWRNANQHTGCSAFFRTRPD